MDEILAHQKKSYAGYLARFVTSTVGDRPMTFEHWVKANAEDYTKGANIRRMWKSWNR